MDHNFWEDYINAMQRRGQTFGPLPPAPPMPPDAPLAGGPGDMSAMGPAPSGPAFPPPASVFSDRGGPVFDYSGVPGDWGPPMLNTQRDVAPYAGGWTKGGPTPQKFDPNAPAPQDPNKKSSTTDLGGGVKMVGDNPVAQSVRESMSKGGLPWNLSTTSYEVPIGAKGSTRDELKKSLGTKEDEGGLPMAESGGATVPPEDRSTDFLKLLSEGGQGLSKAGRALAQYGSGQELRFPDDIGQGPLERVIDEREDTLTPQEIELFKKYKIEIPEGMKRSRLKQILPTLMSQVLSPYEAMSLGLRSETSKQGWERIGLMEEAQALRDRIENRRVEQFDFSKMQLPEWAGKKMNDAQANLDTVDKIRHILQRAQVTTGYPAGYFTNLLAKWGAAGVDNTLLFAELGRLSSAYGKDISGVAVSPKEWARLTAQLPQGWQREGTMTAMLDRLEERQYQERARIITQFGEGAGRTMEGYKSEGDQAFEAKKSGSPEAGEAGSADSVKIRIEIDGVDMTKTVEEFRAMKVPEGIIKQALSKMR